MSVNFDGVALRRGFVGAAFVLCALCAQADAGTLTLSGTNVYAAGTMNVTGVMGVLVDANTPRTAAFPSIAPAAAAAPPLTGVPVYGPRSTANDATAAQNPSRGLDEKWGEPLNADLFGTDSVHAGLHYYYDSGSQGGQGGVGFSLTFKN